MCLTKILFSEVLGSCAFSQLGLGLRVGFGAAVSEPLSSFCLDSVSFCFGLAFGLWLYPLLGLLFLICCALRMHLQALLRDTRLLVELAISCLGNLGQTAPVFGGSRVPRDLCLRPGGLRGGGAVPAQRGLRIADFQVTAASVLPSLPGDSRKHPERS